MPTLSELDWEMPAGIHTFPSHATGLSPECPRRAGDRSGGKSGDADNGGRLGNTVQPGCFRRPRFHLFSKFHRRNRLIKAGAALITSAEDILSAFGLPEKENLKLNLALEPNRRKIYSLLIEPIGRDRPDKKNRPASLQSPIPSSPLMILNGLIKQSGGEIFKA